MRNLLTYDKFFDKNFLIFRSFKMLVVVSWFMRIKNTELFY